MPFQDNPALKQLRTELSGWYETSIQYGLDTDDAGPNEGAGYIISQVLSAMNAVGLSVTDPANVIWATALLMEKVIPDRTYTTDLPADYNDALSFNDEVTAMIPMMAPIHDWGTNAPRRMFQPEETR